jgi:hypothetical protein
MVFLTEVDSHMSISGIYWGKGYQCVGLTSPPSCANCLEILKSYPPRALRPSRSLLRDISNFTIYSKKNITLRFRMASGLGGLMAGLNPAKKRKPLYSPGIEGQFLGRPDHS